MSALEVVMMKRIGELNAEVKCLQAEVERLTALVKSNLNSSAVAMGKADAVLHERDSLKAKVERLIEERCFLNEKLNHFVKQTVQNREQVERLRKAGDDLFEFAKTADTLAHKELKKVLNAWNAAKEGRPNE